MQVNNVTLFSPSLQPADLTVQSIHPFCFPPPWNTYLVPRDAHFLVTTTASDEGACFAAIEDIITSSSCVPLLECADMPECTTYSVVDTDARDVSDAENEASEEEEEDACQSDEDEAWEEEVVEVETFAPPEDEHLLFGAYMPKQ